MNEPDFVVPPGQRLPGITTPQALPVGAVILAAGASSRMGTPKPLLRIGETTALERVTTTLHEVGIREIAIVTGQNSPKLAPLVTQLGLQEVHNPSPEKGMLFSAALGAAALDEKVEAFFVWPADCALVKKAVLEKLLKSFFKGSSVRPAVVRPCCLGRHGHPPLLGGALRETLASVPLMAKSSGPGLDACPPDFRSFLAQYSGETLDVETEDVSVLLDMDTPEDYARLQRFAWFIDRAEALGKVTYPQDVAQCVGPSLSAPALEEADCLFLHIRVGTSQDVQRHCKTVEHVGTALANALMAQGVTLSLKTIKCACLLHDLGKSKGESDGACHAQQAADVLRNLGLGHVAEIVANHIVMEEDTLTIQESVAAANKKPLLESISPTEAEVVFLADMLVVEDRVVTLKEKVEWAASAYQAFPQAVERTLLRAKVASKIVQKLIPYLGDINRPEVLKKLMS